MYARMVLMKTSALHFGCLTTLNSSLSLCYSNPNLIKSNDTMILENNFLKKNNHMHNVGMWTQRRQTYF